MDDRQREHQRAAVRFASAGGAAMLTDLGLGPELRAIGNPMERVVGRSVSLPRHIWHIYMAPFDVIVR